jgi:Domain of unknown function (DUF3943)
LKTYFLIAFLMFLTGSHVLAAQSQKKKVLISVGDIKNHTNKDWKKSTCFQIYSIANQIAVDGIDVTCREFDTNNFLDKDLAILSRSFNYHLRVTKNNDDSLAVDLTNWNRIHESDFKTLGWNFEDSKSGKITKEDAFVKVIGNIFLFASNDLAYKAGLLANGAFESNYIEYDEKNGVFREKMTDDPISINRAFSLFEGESERHANYLKAGITIGVQLSAALAIYYKNLVYNSTDFDYTFKSGLKAKLFTGEAIKYDDNDKFANYGHTFAGVSYYQTARANGFTSLESALITFASSATWEFMEYQEVFSINDQIITPVGGYVIGEATYQIACALVTKDSILAKTLGYTINPNLAFAHGIDQFNKTNRFRSQPECNKRRWSDISVYVGLEKGQKAYEPSENNDHLLGMRALVINIDNYNKEGKDGKVVLDTSMAKMLVENNGNQGILDLKVIAQVVMAAYHQKNISKDENGQLRGYDVILGVGSASTWYDRGDKEDSKNEDFYGTINILGANAHANIHFKGFNIRADFGLYGDFAMVKSYSLEAFKDSRGGDLNDQAGVVRKRGYYWGVGASALAAISVSKDRFEVGYEGQHSSAKSINERHRNEATSNDVFRDSFHQNKFYVSFSLTKNLTLQISREYNMRNGSVNGNHKAKGREKRTMGSLVYKF